MKRPVVLVAVLGLLFALFISSLSDIAALVADISVSDNELTGNEAESSGYATATITITMYTLTDEA